MKVKHILSALVMVCFGLQAPAQKYQVVDKTVAVVGGEMIPISEIESEIQMRRAQGMSSDRNMRCELLESMLESKLLLMQARVDSLTVNLDMVEGELTQQIDRVRTQLGGDDEVEKYFGKPIYKLRNEWRKQFEDMSLTQQEQSQIASKPEKYQLSQICIYPDREAAKLAVKEKLLSLRERIINGEKFSTLARIYSEDPGSARKGGELGMASKTIFWPAFSDAAMALKPGMISQIVETPDGFHIIEVLEKKGDMFNARHILIKPQYTQEDQDKAFKTLDSLKTEINNKAVTFQLAAAFYSQDPATRTNGGQMCDPNTGSSYFEKDQLKPADYLAIKALKVGEISDPVSSLDNEGRSGNTVYKIIRVDKILPAHPATFENDFSELQAMVKNRKQHEAIGKFIDKKISETYIVIDPLFADCDFSRPGWKEKIAKE